MNPRVFLLLGLLAAPLPAQLLNTRNIIVAPADDSAGGLKRFPQPRFFIEAARGWGSANDEQAWNIKLGGAFQIGVGERTVLLGVFAHELTSNPYNDLGYNPRGAMWDENAFVVRRFAGYDGYLGVMFRCRHELDNADGYDERLPDSLRVPTARIMGLGGVQLGATTHERRFAGVWRARAFARVEGYFHRKDARAPDIRIEPDFRDALGTIALGGRVSRAIRPGVASYARGWTSMMVFDGADGMLSRANARAELGIRGWGSPGGMDFHVAYEHFFDDLSRPTPQPSNAIIAGIRVTPSEMF